MTVAFKCPLCGQKLEAEDADTGARLECPACKKQITVPEGGDTEMSTPIDGTRKFMNVSVAIAAIVFSVCLVVTVLQLVSVGGILKRSAVQRQSTAAEIQANASKIAEKFIAYLETSEKNQTAMQENAGKLSTIVSECTLYMIAASLEEEKMITASESKRIRDEAISAIKSKSPRWGEVIEAMSAEFLKGLREGRLEAQQMQYEQSVQPAPGTRQLRY